MTATATATVVAERGLQTEYTFELPMGYEDDSGRLHRRGTMRMARARDEIAPMRDPRVRDNEAYLTVLLLARTVTSLGDLRSIDAGVIEGLFTPDLSFLQDLYRRINSDGTVEVAVTCPSCHEEFVVDLAGDAPGES